MGDTVIVCSMGQETLGGKKSYTQNALGPAALMHVVQPMQIANSVINRDMSCDCAVRLEGRDVCAGWER